MLIKNDETSIHLNRKINIMPKGSINDSSLPIGMVITRGRTARNWGQWTWAIKGDWKPWLRLR